MNRTPTFRRVAGILALSLVIGVAAGQVAYAGGVTLGTLRGQVLAILNSLGITTNGVYTAPSGGMGNPATADLDMAGLDIVDIVGLHGHTGDDVELLGANGASGLRGRHVTLSSGTGHAGAGVAASVVLAGGSAVGDAGTIRMKVGANTIALVDQGYGVIIPTGLLAAFSSDSAGASPDVALQRIGAGALKVTNASSGLGSLEAGALTVNGLDVRTIYLDAVHGIAPVTTSTYAGQGTRNGTVYEAFDVSVNEECRWSFTATTTTATLSVLCMASTATTGSAMIEASLEDQESLDVDGDSFGSVSTSSATACSATCGVPFRLAVTVSDCDGMAAGHRMRLKLRRPTENASDTMLGDLQVIAITVSP